MFFYRHSVLQYNSMYMIVATIVIWITSPENEILRVEWYCVAKASGRGDNRSTRKTFSGRVIHKNFYADKFKSFLKSKKLLLINSTKVTSISNFVDI
jgi:hypothetical protein